MSKNKPSLLSVQPVSSIEWVPRESLTPNDYNPNWQPPPEHKLLKISIVEDGWTQPLVVFDDGSGGKLPIIDGEHRWRCSADPSIQALTGGLVPIVRLTGTRGRRMLSTVRHNRARGEHKVVPMANLVRSLVEEAGYDREAVGHLLQMEPEEVNRLLERAGMPVQVGAKAGEFSEGWIPK